MAGATRVLCAGFLGSSTAVFGAVSWWGARSAHCASATKTRLTAQVDVAIVGGGIIGLAVAREVLQRFPNKTVAVLEKEGEVGSHQSGHNSGVIHAGMYYKPGSVMAKCCVDGARKMYEYCDSKKLPAVRCGKLIVATTEEEMAAVYKLFDNGNKNGEPPLGILICLHLFKGFKGWKS